MSLKTLAPSFMNRLMRAKENLGSGGCLLNVGCGDGEYNRELENGFEATFGIDVNRKEICYAAGASENSYYMVASGSSMPFRDGSFDRISCIDVIEHVDDDESVIREISRVTKKDGILLLSVPHRNFPFTYDPVNALLGIIGRKIGIGIWGFGHLRLYDERGLSRILRVNGFEIERVEYLNSYFSGLVEGYSSNMLYRFFKSKRGVSKKGQRSPPRVLQKATESVLSLDRRLFGSSKRSVGIMIRARKV